MFKFLLAVAALTLTQAAVAQRPDALFEHMKRTTAIAYGAVPVGKHTLAELPAGQSWRLGMNEASTWRCDVPILGTDSILAPGAYRVQLQRSGETRCKLLANGSAQALGSNADGQVDGDLGKCQKPTKKLAIEWRKKGAPSNGNQPAQIVVQFGGDEWIGDVTVLGSKELKLTGWKGVAFTVPSERVEAGAVPVATLTRGDQSWNVVLAKDSVQLVPWMAAPTEQFGFGEITPPDAAATVVGKVEPLEMKVEKPWPVVEVLGAKVEKGELRLELGFAQRAVRLVCAEPKGKAR
jgi:hypothetical protein